MADERYADIDFIERSYAIVYQNYLADSYILDELARISNAAIQSLKSVERREEEKTEDEECTICLEKIFKIENKEAVVKETPCGHRYHGKCIDKWLEIHVSCPLCRYKMTSDNGEEEDLEVEMSSSDEDEEEVEIE